MTKLIPDWVIYLLALAAVLIGIFGTSPDQSAPPPPPEVFAQEGAMLPPASPFDERVLVQVTQPMDGVGTAFAINEDGQWLTARHVVDGCDRVSLLVAPNRYVPVQSVSLSDNFDLALLQTGSSRNPVALDTNSNLRIGTYGYHVGYPQGRPGEVVSRLFDRSNLETRGLRSGRESVLTWAETGRTRGLSGTLGGLSGGPVYDSNGRVRGVVIAESPRRGRIYTASPETVARFLREEGVTIVGDRPQSFQPTSYGRNADEVRRNLQVVKVACDVREN
ncbi:MAG: serine protease [Pseudomonadota bacterium]